MGVKGADRKDREGLFLRSCSDKVRGSGFKLEEGRSRLDSRKKFFTVRVVRHWNRLLSEAVNVPSLEAFKARLDGAVSSLVWGSSLHTAGGCNYTILKVPSNPIHSVILCNKLGKAKTEDAYQRNHHLSAWFAARHPPQLTQEDHTLLWPTRTNADDIVRLLTHYLNLVSHSYNALTCWWKVLFTLKKQSK